MKKPNLACAALAALLFAGPLASADPEEAVGLERGKYGDPNALVTVNFAFDKPDLTGEARALLDGLAAQLQPGTQYEVGGHTDSVGPEAYNQWLSEQRAGTVRRHLLGLGVDGALLTVAGYGETQPVDSNRTRAGRLRNRRVVIKAAQ